MVAFISFLYERLHNTTLGSVSISVHKKNLVQLTESNTESNPTNLNVIPFARIAAVYLPRENLALVNPAGGLESLVHTTEVKILPYRPTQLRL